jgi:hypothetical protein
MMHPHPIDHRLERSTAAQPWHQATVRPKELIFSFYVVFLI